MRIALFHNRYRIRGGEESTVAFEQRTLEEGGHDVEVFEVRNEEVFGGSKIGALKAAAAAPYNRSSYEWVRSAIEKFRPDVGHVHNWFPLISPAIYQAHRDAGVPVVQTLHNYRLGCANGMYFRDGAICEDCRGGGRINAVRNKCYRHSRVQSFAWLRIMNRNWGNGTFTELVDAYIAPSELVRQRHVDMGIPPELVHVVPHACIDPESIGVRVEPCPVDTKAAGAVCVGRTTAEKGVDALLEAWAPLDATLRLAGTAVEVDPIQLRAKTMDNVDMLGEIGHGEVLRQMGSSAFVVQPGRWYEPFGLAVIEAMSCGRAVIASRLGGPVDTVEHEHTGLLVEPGDIDGLREACRRLLENPMECRQFGLNARQRYEERFAPEINRARLLEVFDAVCDTPARQRRVA